jgi:glycosyltransferase involved in cell wall biosynthesis
MPVEKLPPLIAAADVGVVPYRGDAFTQSLLPTKLMEYAAMGLPAVVARTDAISHYFDDTMVKFFAPDDAEDLARCILELHTDRQSLAKLAQGIRSFNQRFSWSKESEKYVALVDRLAAWKGQKDG